MNVECSWTHRAAAVVVTVAALCLTLSACARRPSSDIKPGQPGEMRLVYLNSKAPAAGLKVTQILNANAEEKVETSDRDGRVHVYPNAAVTVTDPEAGNCLLASFRTDARVAASMVIPEAIRISGRIPGERLKELRLQVGFGHRVVAGERFRNVFDRALAINDEENRPFGIVLPPSSSSWEETTVDASGAFTTAWFPASERPALVAWNGAGQVAVEDVPFAGITPRATLDAPPFRFVQTRSVDVHFTAPSSAAAPGPAGAGASAAVPAAHIYLRDARIRQEDREFIARYLSVLDRIDARSFVFATTMRPFTLAPGDEKLRYLPPWADVDLRVMDAIVGDAQDLSLPLNDTPARLDLRAEQLLPQGGAGLPLQGTVVGDRAYRPIAGATVVFSCYPDKFETTTDRFGNFVIPKACVDREATLFVTKQEGKAAPMQATRTHTHRAGAVQRLVIQLPERDDVPFAQGRGGRGRGAPRGSPGPRPVMLDRLTPAHLTAPDAATQVPRTPFPSFPFWSAGLPIPPGAAYYGYPVGVGDADDNPDVMVSHPREPYPMVEVTGAEWYDTQKLQVWVQVRETGAFNVWLAVSPCLSFVAKSEYFTADQPKLVQLMPIGDSTWWNRVRATQAFIPNDPIEMGTAVYFVNPIIEPDPVEVDALWGGFGVIYTCNWQYALVFIGDKTQGCYEDRVTLDRSGYGEIALGACEEQFSSPPVPRRRR